MKRLPRGFTLIEVMVVVVILAIGATIWATMLQANYAEQRRETAIDSQASDMGLLRRAVSALVRSPPAAWTAGQLQTINLATLVADNGLPADFALRNAALGTSPLYQRYAVRAIKLADGKARAVILDTGAVPPTRLDRIGVAASIDGIKSIKEQVALRVRDKHSVVAGVLPTGATSVTGAGAGFQQDIAAYLAGGVAAGSPPAAVVLVGFSELEPGGDPFQLGTKWGQCRKKAVQVGGPQGWRRPQCDAGYTEIAAWPQCSYQNPYLPHYDVYPSDVGAIILGQVNTYFEQQLMTDTRPCNVFSDGYTCDPSNPYRVGVYGNFTSTETDQSVILNGAELEPDPGHCATSTPVQGGFVNGICRQGGADAGAMPGANGYPCVAYGFGVHPSMAALRENAQNILCCENAE